MKKRIVTIPQMGNLTLSIASILNTIGANLLLPPENNKDTLNLGVTHSSETICLPYKLNLGNYIQALESGANTIIMFQSPGSCRLGNYAAMAEEKLKELGYDFEMIVFNAYKGTSGELIDKINKATNNKNLFKAIKGLKVGLTKIRALDLIEKKLFYFRPREIEKGAAERIYLSARAEIDKTLSTTEIKQIINKTITKYNALKIEKDKEILKFHLTGEFFVLLDPFTNMEIEKKLGLLGIEVERQVMFSDWISQTFIPKWLSKKESHRNRAVRFAKKYMTRTVGGDCIESIGDTINAARNNIDGVVHIGPFNCNPEVVSQNILPHVSKKENIPVISLIIDEQTGIAGLETRLEAFVDLVQRQKTSNKQLNKEAS